MPAAHAHAGHDARTVGGRGGDLSLQERFDRLEDLVLRLQRGGAGGAAEGGHPPGRTGRGQPARGSEGRQAAGGHSGGQPGVGGGGGGASRGGRPGDWVCLQCGAQPCFARAAKCFRCKAPRNGALAVGVGGTQRGGGGGGAVGRAAPRASYLGPIGAGGTRPLLGRRGEVGGSIVGGGSTSARDKGPAARAPSTSAGAVAPARAAGDDVAMRGPQGQCAPSIGADADGFQEVQPRGGARSWAAVAAAAATAPPAGAGQRPQQRQQLQQSPPAVRTSNSWEVLGDDMEVSDDSSGHDAKEDGGGGAGDPADRVEHDHDDEVDADQQRADGGRADATDEVDADGLRQIWDSRCAVVRRLERDGQGFPPELLQAARDQRDEAERRWRAARRPQPLFKRLRWAEADLREAETKERARQEELDAHLEQTARRTRDLQERLRVDSARTQRKRQALAALQREGALHQTQGSERAARMAIEGLGGDIVPALGAIIRQLGAADEPVRRDLQVLAASLGRVEGILREGTEHDLASRGPACFDIATEGSVGAAAGDDREDAGAGHGGDGGGGATAPAAGPHCAAKSTRWTKPAENGPWRKDADTTSAEAVEEARRRVRARTEKDDSVEHGAAGAPGGGGGGHIACGGDGDTADDDPSRTNDLAEAARRDRQAAHRQVQQVLLHQQAVADSGQLQEEETRRQQREQIQQEELRRHQAAFEQAAAARAAEEDRRRAELLASLSPEELAQAAELHARNAAVGSQIFGSPAASQLAGLVQQQQQQQRQQQQALLTDHAGTVMDDGDDINRLMAMSAEDLAAWDGQHRGM